MFCQETFYSKVKKINSDLANEFKEIECPVTLSIYDSPEIAKAKAYIWLTTYLNKCNTHMSIWLSKRVDDKLITRNNASEIVKKIGNIFKESIHIYDMQNTL